MKKILYIPSEFDEELYNYGYIVLKQYIRYFFISSVICIPLGCFIEFLYFNIVFIPTRRTLGGFHFNDERKCLFGSILLGVFVSLGSKYVPFSSLPIIFVLFVLFIVISLHNGCIDHPNKPLSSNEKKYYHRKGIYIELALLIITLLLFFKGYHSFAIITVFSI